MILHYTDASVVPNSISSSNSFMKGLSFLRKQMLFWYIPCRAAIRILPPTRLETPIIISDLSPLRALSTLQTKTWRLDSGAFLPGLFLLTDTNRDGHRPTGWADCTHTRHILYPQFETDWHCTQGVRIGLYTHSALLWQHYLRFQSTCTCCTCWP